jgi:hypothetical protein
MVCISIVDVSSPCSASTFIATYSWSSEYAIYVFHWYSSQKISKLQQVVYTEKLRRILVPKTCIRHSTARKADNHLVSKWQHLFTFIIQK